MGGGKSIIFGNLKTIIKFATAIIETCWHLYQESDCLKTILSPLLKSNQVDILLSYCYLKSDPRNRQHFTQNSGPGTWFSTCPFLSENHPRYRLQTLKNNSYETTFYQPLLGTACRHGRLRDDGIGAVCGKSRQPVGAFFPVAGGPDRRK